MLDPEYLERAGTLVGSVYSQIEAEMCDRLVRDMLAGDISDWHDQRILALLAQGEAPKLRAILEQHRGDVNEAVRREVEEALERSDAHDLRVLKEALGVDLPGIMPMQVMGAVRTVTQMLERDNVAMLSGARDLFYNQSAWAVTQAAAGVMGYDEAIRRATRELARKGIDVIQYKDPQTGNLTVRSAADVAVTRHVRSQLSQQCAARTMQVCRDVGCEFVEVSSHFGARPSHQDWEGRRYHVGGRVTVDGVTYEDFAEATGYYGTGDHGGLGDRLCGVNCIVEGTKVWGPSPRAAWRREYAGEVVTIRTALGNQLSVTPNHPILTPQGWVAAHQLHEGSDVLSALIRDGVPVGVGPYDNQRPATIEQKFDALRDSGEVWTLLGSAADFHGDGIANGEVEVVFADVPLVCDGKPEAFEHGTEPRLHGAAGLADGGLPSGTPDIGSPHPPHGVMGGSGEPGALLRSHAGEARAHGVAPAFGGMSESCQDAPDRRLADAQAARDLSLRGAGFVQPQDLLIVNADASGVGWQVEGAQAACHDLAAQPHLAGDVGSSVPFLVQFDQVVDINVDLRVCHVHNLETVSGWYFAENIVTHNCRHQFGPWMPGMPHAYEPNPQHPSGKSNEEIYRLTQKQRRLERAIRASKREVAAAERAYEADPTIKNQTTANQLRDQLRKRQDALAKLVDENRDVLARDLRREYAGDMPRVKVPTGSARSVSEYLMQPSVAERIEADGVSLTKAKQAIAQEMRARELKPSEFPRLTQQQQGDIGDAALSGAIRGDDKRMDEHAVRYYEAVRKMHRPTVVAAIERESGITKEEAERAFSHLFIEEHDLGENGVRRFYEDYEISQSMQRILQGRGICQHDRLLFQHELVESIYMARGIPQGQAHDQANLLYNYQEALFEWLKRGARPGD